MSSTTTTTTTTTTVASSSSRTPTRTPYSQLKLIVKTAATFLVATGDPAALPGADFPASAQLAVSLNDSVVLHTNLETDGRIEFSASPDAPFTVNASGFVAAKQGAVTGFGIITVQLLGSGAKAGLRMEVVKMASIEVFAVPEPVYASAAVVRVTRVAKIKCAAPEVFQQARFVAALWLTNGVSRSLRSHVSFQLDQDSTTGEVDSRGVVTAERAGIVRARAVFHGRTHAGAPWVVDVVDDPVSVTSIDTFAPVAFNFTGTEQKIVLDASVTMSDGRRYPRMFDSNGAPLVPGLLNINSTVPVVLGIPGGHRSGYAVALVTQNYFDPVQLRVTSVCSAGVARQVAIDCNMRPSRPGDIDLGARVGTPLPAQQVGDLISVPVRINTGERVLGGFDIEIFFEPLYLEPTKDMVTHMMAEQSGAVELLGVSSASGSKLHIAGVIHSSKVRGGSFGVDIFELHFNAKRAGTTFISANVAELVDATFGNPQAIPSGRQTLAAVSTPMVIRNTTASRSARARVSSPATARYFAAAQRLGSLRVSAPTRERKEAAVVLPGDVDCDQRIGLKDAIRVFEFVALRDLGLATDLARLVAGNRSACPQVASNTAAARSLLDADQNGVVDSSDARFLLQVIVEAFSVFSVAVSPVEAPACSWELRVDLMLRKTVSAAVPSRTRVLLEFAFPAPGSPVFLAALRDSPGWLAARPREADQSGGLVEAVRSANNSFLVALPNVTFDVPAMSVTVIQVSPSLGLATNWKVFAGKHVAGWRNVSVRYADKIRGLNTALTIPARSPGVETRIVAPPTCRRVVAVAPTKRTATWVATPTVAATLDATRPVDPNTVFVDFEDAGVESTAAGSKFMGMRATIGVTVLCAAILLCTAFVCIASLRRRRSKVPTKSTWSAGEIFSVDASSVPLPGGESKLTPKMSTESADSAKFFDDFFDKLNQEHNPALSLAIESRPQQSPLFANATYADSAMVKSALSGRRVTQFTKPKTSSALKNENFTNFSQKTAGFGSDDDDDDGFADILADAFNSKKPKRTLKQRLLGLGRANRLTSKNSTRWTRNSSGMSEDVHIGRRVMQPQWLAEADGEDLMYDDSDLFIFGENSAADKGVTNALEYMPTLDGMGGAEDDSDDGDWEPASSRLVSKITKRRSDDGAAADTDGNRFSLFQGPKYSDIDTPRKQRRGYTEALPAFPAQFRPQAGDDDESTYMDQAAILKRVHNADSDAQLDFGAPRGASASASPEGFDSMTDFGIPEPEYSTLNPDDERDTPPPGLRSGGAADIYGVDSLYDSMQIDPFDESAINSPNYIDNRALARAPPRSLMTPLNGESHYSDGGDGNWDKGGAASEYVRTSGAGLSSLGNAVGSSNVVLGGRVVLDMGMSPLPQDPVAPSPAGSDEGFVQHQWAAANGGVTSPVSRLNESSVTNPLFIGSDSEREDSVVPDTNVTMTSFFVGSDSGDSEQDGSVASADDTQDVDRGGVTGTNVTMTSFFVGSDSGDSEQDGSIFSADNDDGHNGSSNVMAKWLAANQQVVSPVSKLDGTLDTTTKNPLFQGSDSEDGGESPVDVRSHWAAANNDHLSPISRLDETQQSTTNNPLFADDSSLSGDSDEAHF